MRMDDLLALLEREIERRQNPISDMSPEQRRMEIELLRSGIASIGRLQLLTEPPKGGTTNGK